MLRLRDLLKFEFFFPEKERFLQDVSNDVGLDVPEWRSSLTTAAVSRGPVQDGTTCGPLGGLALPRCLSDRRRRVGATRGTFNEKAFLKACLDRARMYRIEDRLISGESASQVMFKSAVALAENRGLLSRDAGVAARRRDFADEVREARRLAASASRAAFSPISPVPRR